jgi:HEAT repeat protein
LDYIIEKIIPPNEYQFREGFSNIDIIDKLLNSEKEEVEVKLIELLKRQKEIDPLIIDTLVYLKSEKSINTLKSKLADNHSLMMNIIIASAIYCIKKDMKMIDVALLNFANIEDDYVRISAFYYMSKFDNYDIKKILSEYAKSDNYLVSYNAKRFLSEMQ